MATTLDDALKRVVVFPRHNLVAEGIHRSPFFNYFDSNNSHGVIPEPDRLLEFRSFSSREHVFTFQSGSTNGTGASLFTYVRDGVEHPFFTGGLARSGFLEGKFVYVIAAPSTTQPPESMAHFLYELGDAAKENGAERVYAVMSEFFFARQDRGARSYNRGDNPTAVAADQKKHRGQGVTLRVILRNLIANGYDGVVALDHHSGYIDSIISDVLSEFGRTPTQPFMFNLPVEPLIAHYLGVTDILDDDIRSNFGEGIVGIAPDASALERVKSVFELCNWKHSSLAYIDKKRMVPNDPSGLAGALHCTRGSSNYQDKTVLLIDDMADTFGTMNMATSKVYGARRVIVLCTHPILSGDAERYISENTNLTDLVVFGTRPSRTDKLITTVKQKLTILDPALYIAHALVHCVEQSRVPKPYYLELFHQNPSSFSELYDLVRSRTHYSLRKH